MSHDPQHLDGDTEDPRVRSVWVAGIMFAFAVLIVVLFVAAVDYDAEHDEMTEKVVDPSPDNYAVGALREGQLARLEGEPRLVQYRHEVSGDVVEAIVIPIDEAMDRVVAEYGGE